MPYDSNGNYTLPDTYFVENGDTVLPIQHNPVLEDIQSALSSVLLRTGVAPMSADLKMGTFKVTGMGNGTATTDAVNKGQLDELASSRPWELIKKDTISGLNHYEAIDLGAFERIRIHAILKNVTPGSINLRTSSNNGTSYDSGGTDYTNLATGASSSSGGSPFTIFTQAAQIALTQTNTVSSLILRDLCFEDFNKNASGRLTGQISYNSGPVVTAMISCSRDQSAARNALQIQSGSVMNGTILIEGQRG